MNFQRRTGDDGDLGVFPCLELCEWRLREEGSVNMGQPCKG